MRRGEPVRYTHLVPEPSSSLSPSSERAPTRPRRLGRYAIFDAIASGGMATVHLGRLVGPVGFARTVAIKRLHDHLASDPLFRSMFVDEARVAARIQHPNVVPTLDVVAEEGELFLVMEYVAGEPLGRLIRRPRDKREPVSSSIASAIMSGVLHGLHAAHEAKSERGESLDIVHRDVSPQNIIVGTDGSARVLDFGVAKALGRLQTTRGGQIKGKLAYIAPEQLRGESASRQSDIYAAAVVLWEMLAGRRLFAGADEADVMEQVLVGLVDPPSKYAHDVPEALDALVLRGLDPVPARRFTTAREMAIALEKCAPPSLASDVSSWLEGAAGDALAERAARVAAVEAADVAEVVPVEVDVEPARVAVAAPAGETPPRAPARRRFSGVTVVVTIALTAAATAANVRSEGRGANAPSSIPSAPVPDAAVVASSVAEVASVAPSNSSTAMQPAPERSSRTRTSPPPARHPGAAAEDCRIPYTVDGTGRRIYKRSCL
jgi:serine/threonine-protein kinase